MVFKKEVIELRHTSARFLLIMLLPLIPSGVSAFQNGSGGMMSPTLNILASFLFGSFFSTILIRDSIVREKEESTLQMLLLSKFDIFNVIIGKILICVVIGSIFQVFSILLMYGMMSYSGSQLLFLFNIKVFMILPLVSYIMGSVVLLSSLLIDDKKVGEVISMFSAFLIGFSVMIAFNFMGSKLILTIIFMFFLLILNILLTMFLKKIVVHSMFFIKK